MQIIKDLELEDVKYTLKARTVQESKTLRAKIEAFGKDSEGKLLVSVGDYQVLEVLSCLISWSRPEPLNQENFEKLTLERHIDRLFDECQKLNKLSEEEKN